MAKRTFQTNSSAGGGSLAVSANAGNTFSGSITPLPVVFGDGNQPMFFAIGNNPSPTFVANMGNNVTTEKYTCTFQVQGNNVILIDRLTCWLDAVINSPGDQVRLSIQTTSGGNPTGVILASASFNAINSPSYQGGSFASPLELTAGVYAFVIDRTGALDSSNYYVIGAENAGGVNVAPYVYNTGAWTTNNKQPVCRFYNTYSEDSAYLSAPTTGNRMNSVIINSGGGGPTYDNIPTVLQDCHGFVRADFVQGTVATVLISGAVPGFTALNASGLYICDRSDGHVTPGSSGNIVGRAILTDTMLILPS